MFLVLLAGTILRLKDNERKERKKERKRVDTEENKEIKKDSARMSQREN